MRKAGDVCFAQVFRDGEGTLYPSPVEHFMFLCSGNT